VRVTNPELLSGLMTGKTLSLTERRETPHIDPEEFDLD